MPIPPKPPSAPSRNSLIESPTDTPATENCKNKSYDNIENDRPDDDNDNDVDCFPREQPWYSFLIPAYTHNPTQAPNKPTPKRTLITKQSASRDNKNNESPDDDNDNDVDCFPRQDKQPMLPQPDIPPTDTLRPSLTASPTEKYTDPMTTDNYINNRPDNNNDDDNDDDDDTVIHNNRYYDDDDTSLATQWIRWIQLQWLLMMKMMMTIRTHPHSEEDSYHNPNLIIDMYGNTITIDDNNNIIPYDDDDEDDVKPITIQAAQRQINAILAGRTTCS